MSVRKIVSAAVSLVVGGLAAHVLGAEAFQLLTNFRPPASGRDIEWLTLLEAVLCVHCAAWCVLFAVGVKKWWRTV